MVKQRLVNLLLSLFDIRAVPDTLRIPRILQTVVAFFMIIQGFQIMAQPDAGVPQLLAETLALPGHW